MTDNSHNDAATDSRPANDLAAVEARWAEWVESTSRLLAIDPALVDIPAIHDLTKTIAHELDRPLAPVASFMLGVAIGARGRDADPTALADMIAATARGSHGAETKGRPPA